MNRLKRCVASVLVLVWVPAASCCLIEASGLIQKRHCCSEESSHPFSTPADCDQPCGVLASATYLSQQDPLIVSAPVSEVLLFVAPALVKACFQPALDADAPSTAALELVSCWQFSYRTALLPRAPSFAS